MAAWMWFLIIILGILIYFIGTYFYQKRYLTGLTQEEFIKGYRKAQLIDVREQNEYENGHILGARNIPLSQLKMRINEIRKDKPVYLYDQGVSRSARAAQQLYKHGCRDIYFLEGGFKKWSGKVKRK